MSDEVGKTSGQSDEDVLLSDRKSPRPESKSAADKPPPKKRGRPAKKRPLLTPPPRDVIEICDVQNDEPQEKRRRDVTPSPVVASPLAVSCSTV